MKKKLTIICDSNFEIETKLDIHEEVDHRIIVFSHLENTSCIAKFHLNNLGCSAQVTILGIIHNQKKVHIDGQILIGSQGENTSGHLSEEVLIIGNHSYTFTKPVLDVAHNAVSASHGAKIHKIPKHQLFYLMSRGLSEGEAKQIIIGGLIEKMFEGDPEVEIIGTSKDKDINKEKIIQRIYEIIFQ